MVYRVIAFVLLLLITACAPGSDPAPTAFPTAPALTRTPAPLDLPTKLGLHLLLGDGRNQWPVEVWPDHLRAARAAVGEWGMVVQLVRVDDLDLARWQMFMDECAALHLTPVLRLATTFDLKAGWWTAPTADPDGTYHGVAAQYVDFLTALDWPTDQHIVIVGNEPDHAEEWSGRIDPAAYARFLIDVADAFHAADPGARVLNAGLDPFAPNTGTLPDSGTFLDGMAAAYPDVFSRLDAWASHTYPLGPFTRPPWEQIFQIDRLDGGPTAVPPPSGIVNRGVNGYTWELFKLAQYGAPDLPIVITETGWRHVESVNPTSLDDAPPGLPDAATAALYMDLTLRGGTDHTGWTPWLDDPRVIGVIFFALDGSPTEWGHTNWLILDDSGAIQGAYPLWTRLAAISSQR